MRIRGTAEYEIQLGAAGVQFSGTLPNGWTHPGEDQDQDGSSARIEASLLTRIKLKNYRCFENLDLALKPGFNILVGDNGVGKSTILEAINLGLTRRIGRNPLFRELSPHLINQKAARAYLQGANSGRAPAHPPEIVIELFFDGERGEFSGTNNSEDQNFRGVRLRVGLNNDHEGEFDELIAAIDPANPDTHLLSIPTEYYDDQWTHFGGEPLTAQHIPYKPSFVNTSSSRLEPRVDTFTRTLVSDELSPKSRSEISHRYRAARESFSTTDSVISLNEAISKYPDIVGQGKKLSLGIDISQRASWESNIVPHLDDLPLDYVGDGHRNSLKMLLSLKKSEEPDSQILLVEEPENYLSPMRLNGLLDRLASLNSKKQAIISTHSSFVMNKLGMDELVLLGRNGSHRAFHHLSKETRKFFQILPGFDTLRVVLATKLVLVEGPSDDLIFRKAYEEAHSRPPASDLIDVFSVNGVSAKRYLELIENLKIPTAIVVDNDGRTVPAITETFSRYLNAGGTELFMGDDPEVPSLEEHLVDANDLTDLESVLGKTFDDEIAALKWMKTNKTESAAGIYYSSEKITMPKYISDAVKFIHGAQ